VAGHGSIYCLDLEDGDVVRAFERVTPETTGLVSDGQCATPLDSRRTPTTISVGELIVSPLTLEVRRTVRCVGRNALHGRRRNAMVVEN
jgi:hypothetical protein